MICRRTLRAAHTHQVCLQRFLQRWPPCRSWLVPKLCGPHRARQQFPGCSVAGPPDRDKTPTPLLAVPPGSHRIRPIALHQYRRGSKRIARASFVFCPQIGIAPAPSESSSPIWRRASRRRWIAPAGVSPRDHAMALRLRRPLQAVRSNHQCRGSWWFPGKVPTHECPFTPAGQCRQRFILRWDLYLREPEAHGVILRRCNCIQLLTVSSRT